MHYKSWTWCASRLQAFPPIFFAFCFHPLSSSSLFSSLLSLFSSPSSLFSSSSSLFSSPSSLFSSSSSVFLSSSLFLSPSHFSLSVSAIVIAFAHPIMSSSTPSQSTLPTLASRLVAIRQKLLGRGMYLGHDSVRDNVKWQRIRRADHVIDAREVPPSSTSTETPEDGSQPSPSTSSGDEPEIATLSAIVKISSDGFYLTSDGNYRPGGKVVKRLSEVRPSCICEAPTIEPFKSDFERVLENLRWLQREAITPGFTAKIGLFPALPNCFKVRHVLFEVCSHCIQHSPIC